MQEKKIIRVSKEFKWEMAHALWHYDGLCKNLHGHSYILRVTVRGQINRNPADFKNGMVIDFGDLKEIVNQQIVMRFDHSVVLNKDSEISGFKDIEEMFDRIYFLPFQPTAENLVVFFADIIKDNLPDEIELVSVKLNETANSFAEWLAEDNYTKPLPR